MEYKEIVAISGLPGLFQLVSSKQGGAVVKSVEDKSTRFASSRIHSFTPLESIEVFTSDHNVTLLDVFRAMMDQESTLPLEDPAADPEKIKTYFKTVFPTLDEERVHMSDMKKMLKWYGILKANDLLKPAEPPVAAPGETPAEAPAETPAPSTVEGPSGSKD